MNTHARKLVALTLFAFAAVGCDKENPPTLTPRTTAPPGAVTQYTENRSTDLRAIRVTEGVAFALACRDGKGDPCSFDGSTTLDDSIAVVRRAYTDNGHVLSYGTRGNYNQTTYLQETVFIVVGKKVGNTEIRLKTARGDFPVRVEVLEAKK